MKTAPFHDQQSLRPFGGCNRLLDHYQQIGRALLECERKLSTSLLPGQRHKREFGQSVVFVPVEVLESYLDDLLDVGVCDDSLFIRKPTPAKRALLLSAVGAAAFGGSVLAVLGGATVASLSALIITTFLAGLGGALYFVPRLKVFRRFSFATILSSEIARRRGHDRTNVGGFATRLLMRDLWYRGEARGSAMPLHPARAAARYYH